MAEVLAKSVFSFRQHTLIWICINIFGNGDIPELVC